MPTVGENMRKRQFGPTPGYKQPGVDISQQISPPSDWHPSIRQPFKPVQSPAGPVPPAPYTLTPGGPAKPISGPQTPFDPKAAIGSQIDVFTNPRNPAYDMPSPLAPQKPLSYGVSGSWDEANPQQQPALTPPGVHAQPIPTPLPSTQPPVGPFGAIGGLGQAIGQNFQGMTLPQPRGPIGAAASLGQAIGQNFQNPLPSVSPTGAIQPPGPVPYGAGHPAQQGAALAPPGPAPIYQPPRGLNPALQSGGIPPGPPTQMAPGAYHQQLANELEKQNIDRADRNLPPEDPFANPISNEGKYGAAIRGNNNTLLTNEQAGALAPGYMPNRTVGGAYGQRGTQGYAKGDPRNIQDLIDKDKGIARQGNFRESLLADINGRQTGFVPKPKAPIDNTPGGNPALADKNLKAKAAARTPTEKAAIAEAKATFDAKRGGVDKRREAYQDRTTYNRESRLNNVAYKAQNRSEARRERMGNLTPAEVTARLNPAADAHRRLGEAQIGATTEMAKQRMALDMQRIDSGEKVGLDRNQKILEGAKLKAGETPDKPAGPPLTEKDFALLPPAEAVKKAQEQGMPPSEINDMMGRITGKPGNHYQYPGTGKSVWGRIGEWLVPPNTGAYGAVPGMRAPHQAPPAPSPGNSPLAPPTSIAAPTKKRFYGGEGKF